MTPALAAAFLLGVVLGLLANAGWHLYVRRLDRLTADLPEPVQPSNCRPVSATTRSLT